MSADAQVETFLAGKLDEVLVGADTGGLEGLGAQLLILVGDEVDAEREVVDVGTLASQIEDTDLGVGDTTVVPGLGVRLRDVKLVWSSNLMMPHASPASRVHLCPGTRLMPLRSPRFLSNFRSGHPPFDDGSAFRDSISTAQVSQQVCSPCSCSSGSNGRDGGPF